MKFHKMHPSHFATPLNVFSPEIKVPVPGSKFRCKNALFTNFNGILPKFGDFPVKLVIFGVSGHFSAPWRGASIWTRNNKSKLVFLRCQSRIFHDFYGKFNFFMKNPQKSRILCFLREKIKKGGVARAGGLPGSQQIAL